MSYKSASKEIRNFRKKKDIISNNLLYLKYSQKRKAKGNKTIGYNLSRIRTMGKMGKVCKFESVKRKGN